MIVDRRLWAARYAFESHRGWRAIFAGVSGSVHETARRELHAADAALLMLLPARRLEALLPEFRVSLTTVLDSNDPRTLTYLKELDSWKGRMGEHRDELRVMRETVNAIADLAHANLRSYRNWLLGIGGIVSLALAVVAIIHAFDPSFLAITVPRSPDADLGQVEAAGAVGGLLMALFALIRLRVYSGSFELPFWQAVIRIPAGAAAALVGVILVQGKLFSAFNPVNTEPKLLAYAVLFGASPEIVLRVLDNEVNKASDAARTKNDPLKNVAGTTSR